MCGAILTVVCVGLCLWPLVVSADSATNPLPVGNGGVVGTPAVTNSQPAQEQPSGLDPKGYRYWMPFEKTPIEFDYVAGLFRGANLSAYMACERHGVSVMLAIPFAGGVEGPVRELFSATLVGDMPDRGTSTNAALPVFMTRVFMNYFEGAGYVAMASIFSGAYGTKPMVVALFSSPTAEPGTWKYHGKLKGEPADYAKEKSLSLWGDAGGIVRTETGLWRAYMVGYGVNVAAAESAALDGPWKFVRDPSGQVRNVAEVLDLGRGKQSGCFPAVLKVSDREYHLWIADQWPCKAIWHLSSENGLDFRIYGQQPELGIAAAGSTAMKGLRPFLDPTGRTIHGFMPFIADRPRKGGRGWVIYRSTLPVGLQP